MTSSREISTTAVVVAGSRKRKPKPRAAAAAPLDAAEATISEARQRSAAWGAPPFGAVCVPDLRSTSCYQIRQGNPALGIHPCRSAARRVRPPMCAAWGNPYYRTVSEPVWFEAPPTTTASVLDTQLVVASRLLRTARRQLIRLLDEISCRPVDQGQASVGWIATGWPGQMMRSCLTTHGRNSVGSHPIETRNLNGADASRITSR